MHNLPNNCEVVTQYNFLTKFLHKNKYYFLKKFLKKNFNSDYKVKILDLGCGTCTTYKILNDDFHIEYTGIEINKKNIDLASIRYGINQNFKTKCMPIERYLTETSSLFYDIIICFDTFEHMNHDSVIKSLNYLKKLSCKNLMVNIPNEIGPAILLKNLGSMFMGYKRHKEYRLSETLLSSMYMLDKIPAHNCNHKGFDWRKIDYELRERFNVMKFSSPLNLIPIFMSPSIFYICS